MDPWVFGWTQLLTILGFLITICIAIGGFRTFDRWKIEQIEERKIDVALNALSIAYESKFVFEAIRSPMSFPYEWKDMPRRDSENDDSWNHRGSFYAVLKRIEQNKEFFDRLWSLQPRFMAFFGQETESTFLKLHQARRFIEVSGQMLAWRMNDRHDDNSVRQREQMEADIWNGLDEVYPNTNRVSTRLADFRIEIEGLCKPVITRIQSDSTRVWME